MGDKEVGAVGAVGAAGAVEAGVVANACCIACVNISVVITPEFVLLADVEDGEFDNGKARLPALDRAAASRAVVIVFDELADKFDG